MLRSSSKRIRRFFVSLSSATFTGRAFRIPRAVCRDTGRYCWRCLLKTSFKANSSFNRSKRNNTNEHNRDRGLTDGPLAYVAHTLTARYGMMTKPSRVGALSNRRRYSHSPTFVSMMQTADFSKRDNFTDRLYWPRIR